MEAVELDKAMLIRLSHELAHLKKLKDRADIDPAYRRSDEYQHEIANTDETIDFPLHWITDGDPRQLCSELGFDYDSLFAGPAAQRTVLRLQMLDTLLKEHHVNPPPQRQFDVFVSHASEDKDDFVRPLVHELTNLTLNVWYDEFELQIGDSLRRSIDAGISQSKYGLIILSPAFIAKNWTQYELDGLITLQVNGNKSILPVWHNLTFDELVKFSPTLADKLAIDSSKYSILETAVLINDVIRGKPKDRR